MDHIAEEFIRKIIHIDMDAFYASVEQRDDPALRGKPVAVGGSRERGVVAAASYEARNFGVKSAMPSVLAARRCPQLIFVKPNFEKYQAVSQQIRSIFLDYTDLVEPLSLDEAYLDVTHNKQGLPTATRIAKEIRQRIWEKTQLTASAGISINKFLAKVASDINKPNGQKTILPDEALEFLEQLPIGKFYGVGQKTAAKMQALGIQRGADLKAWELPLLLREFGKTGAHYYHIVRGQQKSRVRSHREAKSVGAERTFGEDLSQNAALETALRGIFEKWMERIERKNLAGRTVTLKLKYHDFEQHTRSHSMEKPSRNEQQLWQIALALLHESALPKPLRLLGLSLSNFGEKPATKKSFVQLTLNF